MIHFVSYSVQFSLYAKYAAPSFTNIVGHLIKSLKLRLSIRASGLHFRDRVGAELVEVALFELTLIHSIKNESVIDINCNNSAALNAHNNVALTLKEARNRRRAHLGCGESVTESGRAASYYVTETGKLCLDIGFCVKALNKRFAVAVVVILGKALCKYADKTALSVCACALELLYCIVLVEGNLGNCDNN